MNENILGKLIKGMKNVRFPVLWRILTVLTLEIKVFMNKHQRSFYFENK